MRNFWLEKETANENYQFIRIRTEMAKISTCPSLIIRERLNNASLSFIILRIFLIIRIISKPFFIIRGRKTCLVSLFVTKKIWHFHGY